MYTLIKSIADRLVALIALLCLLPLLLLVSILVYLSLGLPIFFLQTRPGYKCQLFPLIKFRTMSNSLDSFGHTLPDRKRITRLGSFLRSTSIDELPSLVNVVCGDLSFIGPRPLLVDYLPLYSPEQLRRHDVKPGLSGLAQISGRNSISWDEKFSLDVWYVDHQGFLLDFQILFLTFWKVLRRDGISAPGEATAHPFTGSLHKE